MAAIIVYGIPNCDTIKKTLNWFKENKINFHFYDYKKEGIYKNKLTEWCSKTGWEMLLNKNSTTWRNLSLSKQEKIISQSAAINLMIENTSIIKRPVIESGDKLFIGFDEIAYAKYFLK